MLPVNAPVILSAQAATKIRGLLFMKYDIFITSDVVEEIAKVILAAIEDNEVENGKP